MAAVPRTLCAVVVTATLAEGEGYTARKWGELRDVHVPPSKIMSPPLSIVGSFGLGGLFKKLGFGEDWLRIEGIDDPDLLNSNNFEYEALEDPREWAAKLSPSHKVTLKVGSRCQCEMTGLAVYAKADNTAWMRLQFEQCQGCESTAERAGLVIPLIPKRGAESNLVKWMCDLFPHEPCQEAGQHPPAVDNLGPSPPGEAETVASTLASTTTTSSTSTTFTTTSLNTECFFTAVHLSTNNLGAGVCEGQEMVVGKKVRSENDCLVACELLYLEQQLMYGSVDAMNRNLPAINKESTVCKGYAYDDQDKLCNLYVNGTVDTVKKTGADQDGFVCVGYVSANEYVLHQDHASPECTTRAPVISTTVTSTITTTSTTATTTSTTRTTTTSTTTVVQSLNLLSAFGDLDVRKDVGVFSFPDEVHFHKDAREATMMQLQSPCFEGVDYYLLSSHLPIDDSQWSKLLEVLQGFNTQKVSDGFGQCPASATVDRLPVEVDFGRSPGSVSHLSPAATFGGLLLFISLSVALVVRCAIWARHSGDAPGVGMTKSAHEYFQHYVSAVFASALTFAGVYVLGLFACWLCSRAAHKQLSLSGGGGLLTLGPVLFKACAPMAGTAAGAVVVMWLWPRPQRPEQTRHGHIPYQPFPQTHESQPQGSTWPVNHGSLSSSRRSFF